MSAVWKFELTHPRTLLNMPTHARVLSVGVQGDDIVLWAQVNQGPVGTEQRVFNAFNTGEQLPLDLWFIGTVQVGPIVWHVFEVER